MAMWLLFPLKCREIPAIMPLQSSSPRDWKVKVHFFSLDFTHCSPLKVILNITKVYMDDRQSAKEHQLSVELGWWKAQISLCFLKHHPQKHSEHSFHSTLPEHKGGGGEEQFLYKKKNQNLGINKFSPFILNSRKYYKVVELHQNQKGIHILLSSSLLEA